MQPEMLRKSYALWLMPSGEACRRLARAIRQLSREYSTPVFAPHVTLASSLAGSRREVLAKCGALARQIPHLTLRVARLECRAEYFRCVYARVSANVPLVRAHRLAKQIFALRKQRPFMPHLSLVYGDLRPSTKRQIITSFGRRCHLEFEARSLHVVAIQGPPSHWRRVRTFRLVSQRHGAVPSRIPKVEALVGACDTMTICPFRNRPQGP